MKSLHSCLILLSLGCSLIAADEAAKAPAPTELDWKTANRGSISISVQETVRGKLSSDSFKTDYGSYDRAEMRFRSMDVSVRNSSPTPVKITTEVLWFIAPERPPKSRISQEEPAIVERQIISETPIEGLKTQTKPAHSILKSSRTRLEALGESYADGSKFAGWAVVVRSEAKVIAFKTSSSTIERMITQQQGASIKAALVAVGEPEQAK